MPLSVEAVSAQPSSALIADVKMKIAMLMTSVISGTTYVAMPEGASAIKFEDPRLAMMMAAPGRVKDADEALRQFIYVAPACGDVLLWESWLRHEVPMNMSEDDRISVSFNYGWT